MSLATLFRQAVTITRRLPSATIDGYGGEIPDEEIVETVGNLQQRRRDEPGDGGELSITEWLLFLPVDTVLRTGDLVTVAGEDYEVVGEPENMTMGSPAVHHMEATLRRTAGANDEEEGS